MNYWLTYVRYGYEIILEAEARLCINLEPETEAYMVHLFARYLDKPALNTEPVCLRLMQGTNLPPNQKRQALTTVAEECLLINGLELAKQKWPTSTYYAELGSAAFEQIAYIKNPIDVFYTGLAGNFKLLSRVLNQCRAPL